MTVSTRYLVVVRLTALVSIQALAWAGEVYEAATVPDLTSIYDGDIFRANIDG